jgi:hypothetical protein
VKFHVPVPLLVTQYLCLIHPRKSNDCHSHSLIFIIILANNIFLSTALQCIASLQCVGWTEEKSPKVILQYSHASEQIHKHSAKNKDYYIIHKNNYVFFPQTLESRETHSGGNLTIIFVMQYLNWGKMKHDFCDIWLLCSLGLLATTLKSVASETSRPASTFLEQLLLGERKWGRWIMSHYIH